MQQQATFWSDVGTGMAWTSLIVYGWVCLAPVAFCLTRFVLLVSYISALTVGEQKWLLTLPPSEGHSESNIASNKCAECAAI